ncbi:MULTISPECIES: hypothetical protein [Microbacterium]|uniref:Uncharacterized protein n=1 Tax=Microbacterium wangchenii TaxID=2541726 RepID=A0ABX5SVB2_9MICO|nr:MULTISPECIES: hypothetical protein [Microbacterium]MCK6065775.1 hypothetical protein [Microbacterium sp. EYE_512]QBR90091.1 hypothetical protein E4K62_16215 [Microbacterium wangchenii]
MNEQLMITSALGVICAASAAFALMLPALAFSFWRLRPTTVARASAAMAALAAIALALAAMLGATPAAHLLLT